MLIERLAQPELLVGVGIYDALTALIAEQAGFEAVFLSGSAVAYSQLARPDIGLVTLTETALSLERIRDRVELFILVDADSGFGSLFNVQRTVRTLERAGASGIQLEDQENTKRASQVTKRPVIAKEAMVGKIKAALDARQNDATLISARTDAFYTLGLDEALERADAYSQAGADMVFVEGLSNKADISRLAKMASVPILYNLLEPNKFTLDELSDFGVSMALYPGVLINAVTNGARVAAASLAKQLGLNTVAEPQNLAINSVIGSADFLARGYAYDPDTD